MASYQAVYHVGLSVTQFLKERLTLRQAAQADPVLPDPQAIVYRSLGGLAKDADVPAEGLSLLCYRVLPSAHQRPQAQSRGMQRPRRLALDLHYLLTAWSGTPDKEQGLLAWAMLELCRHPIFDRATLKGGEAIWDPDETVHFVPEPVTHDALFRLWDALLPKYRLSTGYCARVIHIEDRSAADLHGPVVETDFGFGQTGDALLESAT
jgi:hypothetical protein